MRGLSIWGGRMLFMSIAYLFFNYAPDDYVGTGLSSMDMLFLFTNALMFGLTIYLGFKGNEITAKHLLENGWEFAENDQAAHYAKEKWSLA